MRVGYKLRREIEDLFPSPCTPAERLTGLEIAEFGNEASRISLIPRVLLMHRTGLSDRGLRDVLQRLSERGLEFRIEHGKDRNGRPVYAVKDREIEYRVPEVSEFAAIAGLILGGTAVPPSGWRIPSGKPP
jgi:hypothetical protein